MKLFKKRDTATIGSIPSPSSSIDKSSLNHSPPSAKPGLVANGASPQLIGSVTSVRDGSQYPWSSKRIGNNNPFPRYGHAVNSMAGKDLSIYIFGGLVKERAMSDLWVIHGNTLQSSIVSTTGEAPSARVGHAALLIGNAFIVFGGDTKPNGIVQNPNIDDSLYLLNTTTKIWTIAKAAGAKPSGRYGHTLNMLGPKVLVFGGQVEGFFFNDLVAFDLNTLNHAQPRWELINPVEGCEPPPARTNHVAVTHNDKLYVFGGTNGVDWYNDIWRFDPVVRNWTLLTCSGFVPEAREGHSASLVGDVIYVFGGRDIDGNDLGDLSAFKISTSRWFTFQNMGTGPSPRSGHALCTIGKKIFVVGGEGASNRGDEQNISVLDTTKIRFPTETRPAGNVNEPIANDIRAASVNGSPTPLTAPSIRSVSGQSTMSSSRLPQSSLQLQKPPPSHLNRRASHQLNELRSSIRPMVGHPQRISSQPTPFNERQQAPREHLSETRELKRSGSLDSMRNQSGGGGGSPNSDLADRNSRLGKVKSLEELKRSREPLIQSVMELSVTAPAPEAEVAPALRHMDSSHLETLSELTSEKAEPAAKSRPLSAQLTSPDLLLRLTWLEAELNLARKSGYTIQDTSQALEESTSDTESTKLMIAMRTELLKMQSNLNEAKTEAEAKANIALAERDIALKEAAYEKSLSHAIATSNPSLLQSILTQRNRELETRVVEHASQYRMYERQVFGLQSELASTKRTRADHDELLERHDKAVADAEQINMDLLVQHNSLRTNLAETQDLLQEHQARRIEAESKLSSFQIETAKLRDLEERHERHMHAFEVAQAATAAATSRASIAEVQLEEERTQLEEERQRSAALTEQVVKLTADLESVRIQLQHRANLCEKTTKSLDATRLEAESARSAMTSGIEALLNHYKESGPHDQEQHQATLDRFSRELSETRAMHQESQRILNAHLNDTNELHEKLQSMTSENTKLNNNTLALHRRLAAGQNEYQDLQSKHVTLTEELARKESELEESGLKLSTLQQIVTSRPVRRDSLEKRRSRNLTSPSSNPRTGSQTPDATRMRDLEQKLVESVQLQQEMYESHQKNAAEIATLTQRHQDSITRQEEAEHKAKALEEELGRTTSSASTGEPISPSGVRRSDSTLRNPNKEAQLAQARAMEAEKQLSESTQNYKERLGQLEADYQSAVHYVKGTEKMLRRMKEELGKYKSANAVLLEQLEEVSRHSSQESIDNLRAAHEERSRELEGRLAALASEKELMNTELSDIRSQLKSANSNHTEKIAHLESQIAELSQTNGGAGDASRLRQLEFDLSEAHLNSQRLGFENRDLERRKNESEAKVKMLLNQFEQSVDSYRRQSTLLVSPNSDSTSIDDTHNARNSSTEHDDRMAPPILNGTTYQQRTSSALDLLANELDQLRSHWESSARGPPSVSSMQTPELSKSGLFQHELDESQQ